MPGEMEIYAQARRNFGLISKKLSDLGERISDIGRRLQGNPKGIQFTEDGFTVPFDRSGSQQDGEEHWPLASELRDLVKEFAEAQDRMQQTYIAIPNELRPAVQPQLQHPPSTNKPR